MKFATLMGYYYICLASAGIIAAKSIQYENISRELADLRQVVADLSSKIQILNGTLHKEKAKNVMFYAIIKDKSFTFNKIASIVFESVIINEGGHYDRYDGVFVAPVKGIYMFSWTVTGQSSNFLASELVVEEKVIASAGEQNAGGGYPSGSMTAFCKMEAGEHAWIRSTAASTGHYLYSSDEYPQSGFLGILIKEE